MTMKIFNFFLLFWLSFNLLGCASAQTNKRQTSRENKSKNVKPMNNKPSAEPIGETKIIHEDSYGTVETPFIFAARSAETYEQLGQLIENLPPAAEIDFTKAAVVAAFAGTKNTGGYSVAIRRAGDAISIEVVEPPKDAVTTDALTQPFAVALVPVGEENVLPPLKPSANWRDAMRNYKITSAQFESSGGIAGRLKKFSAEGTIGVLSFGDFITIFFDLAGKGADKNLRLTETASGVLKDGKVSMARLNAGSFAEGPKPPLAVSGTIVGDTIFLSFEPLPSRSADGFQVGGKIEAARIKQK